MIFLAVIDRRIELSQDVLLFSRHIYRNLHSGMNVQVALLSIANTTDAVASQAEGLSGLLRFLQHHADDRLAEAS